jgi:hypothetical protein
VVASEQYWWKVDFGGVAGWVNEGRLALQPAFRPELFSGVAP